MPTGPAKNRSRVAEIILQDRDGNVISLTANDAGNFWTTAPIASNPYTVVSHSGIADILYVLDAHGNLVKPADPTDPRTWIYKAWVRNGSAVRPMLTIAPVASTSGMIMSCNMHHSPTGSRGALRVSAEPTLPSYPATRLSYNKHIYPILNNRCDPCHVPGNTMTRWVTKSDIDTPSTSFDYSHGLDLQNYAGSSVSGYVKLGVRSVVDTAHPAESLILNKTLTRGSACRRRLLGPDQPGLPGPQTVDHGRGPEEFRLQPAGHLFAFIG